MPAHTPTEHVLFDGSSREGWVMAGAGDVALVDGVLETRGGMGLLWYAARGFRDFVLTLEWRATKTSDNSGVFVRFPDPQGDPWDAVHRGYEVQILDDASEPERRTGAIYTFTGPEELLSRPPGRWNDLSVRAEGQDYTVEVNGRLASRLRGERAAAGHIGLQNHDDRSRVHFRDVRVHELGTA